MNEGWISLSIGYQWPPVEVVKKIWLIPFPENAFLLANHFHHYSLVVIPSASATSRGMNRLLRWKLSSGGIFNSDILPRV
jgi:hypothetical protein